MAIWALFSQDGRWEIAVFFNSQEVALFLLTVSSLEANGMKKVLPDSSSIPTSRCLAWWLPHHGSSPAVEKPFRREAGKSAAPGGGEVCPVSRVGEDEPHPLLRRFSRIPSPLPGCPGCQLCPDAWLLRRCRCYWFSKKLGTWTEGKEHCEGEGSQLLVLQDGKELVKRGANGGASHRAEVEEASPERSFLVDHLPFLSFDLEGWRDAELRWRHRALDLSQANCSPSGARRPSSPMPPAPLFSQETTREILNESKPVWIGLRASEKQWKWVDNSTPSAEV